MPFLAGLFSGAGYAVESNYESGLGRPDLIVKDRVKRRAAVLEIKVSRKASSELCDMQIYKKPENPLVGLSENR